VSTAEWLRAIGRFKLPHGWRLASVGSRYDLQLGKMLNADRAAEPRSAGAAPYLRNVNVQWGSIKTDDLKWMRFSTDDRARYALRRGDLLVCEGGEIGRCAIWDADNEDCFFQKALIRVRSRGPDTLDWLALCLRALSDGGALSAGTDKSTIGHLPAEKLKALRIPLPQPEEQRDVVRALDYEVGRLDDLAEARTRQRELVRERVSNALESAFSPAPGRRPVRLKQVLRTSPCYGVLVPRFDPTACRSLGSGTLLLSGILG
jgi:type I restriction enzyme S subunit